MAPSPNVSSVKSTTVSNEVIIGSTNICNSALAHVMIPNAPMISSILVWISIKISPSAVATASGEVMDRHSASWRQMPILAVMISVMTVE